MKEESLQEDLMDIRNRTLTGRMGEAPPCQELLQDQEITLIIIKDNLLTPASRNLTPTMTTDLVLPLLSIVEVPLDLLGTAANKKAVDGSLLTDKDHLAPSKETADPDPLPSTEVNSPVVVPSPNPLEGMTTDRLDHNHVADLPTAPAGLHHLAPGISHQSHLRSRTVTVTISTIKYYIVTVVAPTPILMGPVFAINMREK